MALVSVGPARIVIQNGSQFIAVDATDCALTPERADDVDVVRCGGWVVERPRLVSPLVGYRLSAMLLPDVQHYDFAESGPRFDYHASADFLEENGFPDHVIAMLRALGGPLDTP